MLLNIFVNLLEESCDTVLISTLQYLLTENNVTPVVCNPIIYL